MPSRRTFLGAVGTGVPLTLAGCLNANERVEGYVQFKVIDGLIAQSSRTEEVPIINVEASNENDTLPADVHLNEIWADQFPTSRMPVVPDTLHDALTAQFDSVRYVVGDQSGVVRRR